MKPGIKQISEETGYSIATISNALNGKKSVGKKTAEKILQVAEKIGYFQQKEIKKIKLVSFRDSNQEINNVFFYQPVLDGVEICCSNNGYELTVCNYDIDIPNKLDILENLFKDPSYAVILLGTELLDIDFSILKDSRCPYIVLDYWRRDIGFSSIKINDYDSAKNAVDYLFQKGHTSIGYLRGEYRFQSVTDREKGVRKACQDHGYPLDERYVADLPSTMDEAYEAGLGYLKKSDSLPTAYFADNDVLALGFMRALHDTGYNVPEDISLIGFDNLPHSEVCSPRLTTMSVPRKEMGILAATQLIDSIKRIAPQLKIEVCAQLIERESVAPPKTKIT